MARFLSAQRTLSALHPSHGKQIDFCRILEAADPRVRVARMEHRGVSATRNTGLLEASTDLSRVHGRGRHRAARRIELQYEALSDYPHAAICHTQVQVIDEDEAPVGDPHGGERTYFDLLRASFLYMTSLMVRRQPAVIAGGFDTLMRVGEDIDFVLRLAKDYDLVYVPEVLTLYRRHPANTKTSPLISQRVIDPILRAHQRWALEHGWTEAAEAAARGARSSRRINALGASHGTAVQAWKAGRLVEAGRQLGISLRIHPQVAPEDFVRGVIKRVHPER